MIQVKTTIPYNPSHTVPFLVASCEPKNISKILKSIASVYPKPESHSYLKRVRKNTNPLTGSFAMEILIRQLNAIEVETDNYQVPSTIATMVLSSRAIHVPVQRPRTRSEYDIAQQFWPGSFHNHSSSSSSSSATTTTEADSIETLEVTAGQWMQEAFASAHAAKTTVGCIIVDPMTKCIVAKSCDGIMLNNSKSNNSNNIHLHNRLRTPIMCCIDIVAQSHVPASYRARSIANRLSEFNQKKEETSSSAPSTPSTTHHLIDDVRVENIRQHRMAAETSHKEHTVESAYLCTGLDVYVTVEPSPMDAMALLHSRVKRVFYHSPDSVSGVLGSKGMLHEKKTINHRYTVYCLQPTAPQEHVPVEVGVGGSTKRKIAAAATGTGGSIVATKKKRKA
jgi:tRNA(Arg) A34 adenosine deaminase TadA